MFIVDGRPAEPAGMAPRIVSFFEERRAACGGRWGSHGGGGLGLVFLLLPRQGRRREPRV